MEYSSGISILVIDDEQYLRTSLGLILQRAGYNVTLTSSGAEAICALETRRFDLAFLDLKMPDMEGTEVLPRLLGIQPDLPVLILTANSSLDLAVKILTSGAAGYMLKPLDPDQILIRVKEVLLERRQYLRRQEILREIQSIVTELRQI